MVKSSYQNSSYSEDDSELFSGLIEYLKKRLDSTEDDFVEENWEISLESMPALDIYNQNTIYFIAGYLINSVIKKSSCCAENCLSKFILETPPYEVYSTLTEYRDFTGNSLTYVNFNMYMFFVQMARIFLYNLHSLIKVKKSVKIILTNLFNQQNSDLNICEKSKNLLFSRFATFCLKISCSKRQAIKDYSSLSMSNAI